MNHVFDPLVDNTREQVANRPLR